MACCASPDAVDGRLENRTSTSVYATSRPRATYVLSWLVSADALGVEPTMKWPCRPTPSIFAPAAWMSLIRFTAAVDFAPEYSML